MSNSKSEPRFEHKLIVKVTKNGDEDQFELVNSIIRNQLEWWQVHYKFMSYMVLTSEVRYSYYIDICNHQNLIEQVTDTITEQVGPCVSLCDIITIGD